MKFTVIRGNISEIRTLAAGSGTTKGVDADTADKVTDETLDKTVAFAKAFAARTGAVVAVTGAIDIVADGERAFCIRNGHPMMSAVTDTGCQLSALTAAFCAPTRTSLWKPLLQLSAPWALRAKQLTAAFPGWTATPPTAITSSTRSTT